MDQLKVDGDRVGGGLQAGRLKSYQFVLGAVAQDSSDRLMYDRTTGHLWFDRDGTGNSNAILLVTFANQSQLNASDLNYCVDQILHLPIGGSSAVRSTALNGGDTVQKKIRQTKENQV